MSCRIAAETEVKNILDWERIDYHYGVIRDPRSTVSRAMLRSASRARWLADVATALDRASRLTLKLSRYAADSGESIVLRAQILALRTEVDAIRRGRAHDNDDVRPDLMK